ncbi:MAG: HAMP domain-containing protein [Burkholderiales bacterium]
MIGAAALMAVLVAGAIYVMQEHALILRTRATDEGLAHAVGGAGRALAASISAAALCVVALSVLLYRSIIQPIRALTDVADTIMAVGDLSKRAPVTSKDEIGRLAKSFNSMTDVLGRSMVSRLHVTDVLSSLSESLIVVGPDGEILKINQAAAAMLGYSERELAGRPFASTLIRKQDLARLGELVRGESAGAIESALVRKDGHAVPVLITQSKVVGLPEDFGVVFAAMDLSERKADEDRLRSFSKRVEELAQHLQAAQETERHRIAREIHDDLGSLLTAMRLHLQPLRADKMAEAARVKHLADEVDALVRAAQTSLDRIVEGLRPQALEHLGLGPALEMLAENFSASTGMSVTPNVAPIGKRVEAGIALALFRVAQECLNNVVKHARARHARLTLAVRGDSLVLEVGDDGAGIERPPPGSREGHGITGMRQRIVDLGGVFEIKRADPGTLVSASFPRTAAFVGEART